MLYFSLVFEGGLFPKFFNKMYAHFFPKIPINSFKRIHMIGFSWFNDSLIISYLAFQLLNLGCIIYLYVKPSFG
jgi:hypothetical protein